MRCGRTALTRPFFTIGHSTRPIEEFVALLQSEQIELVVDVRTMPRSRRNPQFNEDSLPQSLLEFQIGYEHIAELGGLRGRQRSGQPSANTFWTNESFRNYADYAQGAPFRTGLARLRELGNRRRSAVMCAEAVWWRCHRRIIADYLISAGESVFHILGPEHVEAARLSPVAKQEADGSLVYAAPLQNRLPIEPA